MHWRFISFFILFYRKEALDRLFDKMDCMLVLYAVIAVTLCALSVAILALFISERRHRAFKDIILTALEEIKKGNYAYRISSDLSGGETVATKFNETAEALENTSSEIRDMVSATAHDMKTPMTTIAGFAEALVDGTIKSEDAEKYLKLIRADAIRLSDILNGLSDVYSVKYYSMLPFDVCESTKRVLLTLEPLIEEKQLDVVFAAQRDNMLVIGDESAIYRVIYNLCENAVKFSVLGGKFEVKIELNSMGRTEVSIYNEGYGIPSGDIDKIFDRSYRASNTKEKGSGLGLYISSKIIDSHGGKLSAESREGEYAVFTFSLESVADKANYAFKLNFDERSV